MPNSFPGFAPIIPYNCDKHFKKSHGLMIVITYCNMSTMTIAPVKTVENKKILVRSDATHVLVKRIRIRVRIIEPYGRNSLGTSHSYTDKIKLHIPLYASPTKS
jgi:hypothetical protein